MTELRDYTIEVFIDGEPTYLIDGKASSAKAASRRAFWSIVARDGLEPEQVICREYDDAAPPPACEWFARCENAATISLPHPVLGTVPTCERCAEKVRALS